MNYKLQGWLENEVYPHIFKYADKIFTEHNFKNNGDVWHSNTYIDGTSHNKKTR